jgi:hypothetical protein
MINSLLNYIHNHQVFLTIIIGFITAIILFTQLIIFFFQLCVFRKQVDIAEKQNEISEEQNKIIKNQLLIDSRREHSGEIKNNVISYLKEVINKMPYIEIPIPQFDYGVNDNWIIEIENQFSLTKENFFEKAKSAFALNSRMTNIDNSREENALYDDFLENHLGEDKNYFMENLDTFLEHCNKYHDIIVNIQQKFKNKIENKGKDIEKRTIKNSFELNYALLRIIYCSWRKNLEIENFPDCSVFPNLDLDRFNKEFKIESTLEPSIYADKEFAPYSITERQGGSLICRYRAGGSEKDLEKLFAISRELLEYTQTNDFKKFKSDLDYNKNKIEELKTSLIDILSKINNRPILEGYCKFIND